jgi:hypothetical protein
MEPVPNFMTRIGSVMAAQRYWRFWFESCEVWQFGKIFVYLCAVLSQTIYSIITSLAFQTRFLG